MRRACNKICQRKTLNALEGTDAGDQTLYARKVWPPEDIKMFDTTKSRSYIGSSRLSDMPFYDLVVGALVEMIELDCGPDVDAHTVLMVPVVI